MQEELISKLREASQGNYNGTNDLERLCGKAARAIEGNPAPVARNVFSMNSAVAVLELPAHIDSDELPLLIEWLELQLRMLKRKS